MAGTVAAIDFIEQLTQKIYRVLSLTKEKDSTFDLAKTGS